MAAAGPGHSCNLSRCSTCDRDPLLESLLSKGASGFAQKQAGGFEHEGSVAKFSPFKLQDPKWAPVHVPSAAAGSSVQHFVENKFRQKDVTWASSCSERLRTQAPPLDTNAEMG